MRRDLAAIEVPPAEWMRPRLARRTVGRAFDVVIVGAGLSGLSIGFGLRRQRIDNFVILDQQPAGREGPWITCARMATLRSPKQLTGPDLGVPSLAFRSWYEAVAGAEAWERLDKIPPRDWMAYLAWYRRVLDLPVRNETRLTTIAPAGDLLALSVARAAGRADGLLPAASCLRPASTAAGARISRRSSPRRCRAERYTHSAEEIDPAAFAGREIGVLGAASSAFDWATTALEHSARSATVFARRRQLPQTEALAWANFPGFLGAFADLDDVRRWRFMRRFFELQAPPTQEMFNRAARHRNFHLALGAPLREVAMKDGRIRIEAGEKIGAVDHLLLGTGFETDLDATPGTRRLSPIRSRYGAIALRRRLAKKTRCSPATLILAPPSNSPNERRAQRPIFGVFIFSTMAPCRALARCATASPALNMERRRSPPASCAAFSSKTPTNISIA